MCLKSSWNVWYLIGEQNVGLILIVCTDGLCCKSYYLK
jgi:hypothetical protein